MKHFPRNRWVALAAATGAIVVLTAGCSSASTGAASTGSGESSLATTSAAGAAASLAPRASVVGTSATSTGSTGAMATRVATLTSARLRATTAVAVSVESKVKQTVFTRPTGSSSVVGTSTTSTASVGTTATRATAPVTTRSRATTPVPAPGGGNVKQTVPTGTVSTKAPVAMTSTAAYGNGVTVIVSGVRKINTTAELPGEIAGPGVQLTIVFRNGSPAPIDLGNVVVDLQDAAGVSATSMTATPAEPVSGSLKSGATATGIYVFTLGRDFPGPAHLSVSYSAQAPVVLFSGPIS